MKIDTELLSKLTEVFGVPGYEKGITDLMVSEFKKLGYAATVDRIGNVIAKAKGAKKEGALMLCAHMDEIGLLVKYINEKGFIRFIKIGGIDNRVLLNQRVVIQTNKGNIYGVIGSKPPHLMKEEEMKKAIESKELFIDIGAGSRKEAKKMGVSVGDPISFDIPMKVLNKRLITGKALDNRVGCYVLLETAMRLKKENVVFVGSVQEEVSTFGKGAMLSAYAIDPRAFIAIDTAIAGDHPEMKEEEGAVELGKGPVLSLVEAGGRGNVADRRLTVDIEKVAKKNKIPYQIEVMESGATDAASVYRVKSGVPSIAICVPTRYIHSNVAVCSSADIGNTINLVVKAVKSRVGV